MTEICWAIAEYWFSIGMSIFSESNIFLTVKPSIPKEKSKNKRSRKTERMNKREFFLIAWNVALRLLVKRVVRVIVRLR
ncbi:MAG: hypothetical protein Q7J54_05070 [Candidatus Woesearchaeota archaeon]|nr:hypothetical protein [Candidatus Woesearchaeota archaeon]